MAKLAEIPGVTEPVVALLNAAGFQTPSDLAEAATDEVLAKIKLANSGQDYVAELPTAKAVTSWQRAAKVISRAQGQRKGVELPPMAAAMSRQPKIGTASIIAASELKKAGISVDAVPIAELLDDDEMKAGESPPPVEHAAPREGSAAEQGGRGEGIRFKSMETAPKAPPPAARRNAGMSHHAPVQVWFAAAATLTAQVMFMVGLMGTVGIVVLARFSAYPLPKIAVTVPALIPAALLLWGLVGTKARCRLCGQRVFVPKKCLKHVKAARSIFGHVWASALRACFLLTFRCQFCGTKIRLEKKATPADGSP